MDKVTAAVIADHIASTRPSPHLGGHSGIGTLPIVLLRHRRAEEEVSARLASGETVGAYALSESTSGSDAMNCPGTGRDLERRQHYILNGEKMWITNAGFADLFTVFAKIAARSFQRSWSSADIPGFIGGWRRTQDGQRGSSTCPYFERLQGARRKSPGRDRHGHVIAFNILNIGRFKLGAMCVGGARVSLENAIGYASRRKPSTR